MRQLPLSPLLFPGRLQRSKLHLLTLAVLCFSVALARAQNYTSIVVFGDSLSDTGNVAHLTQSKYALRIPSPIADYADGRFTDSTNTVPAAHNYNGVWIEQLAAMLPNKPVIKNSLDGGTNYAYGYASTAHSTSVLALNSQLSVTVDDVGQQITGYLATHPKIDNKVLFVVWAGAIDVLGAKTPEDIVHAAANQTYNIERLILAGATQFIIPNLPPLGAIPKLNGSPATAIPATAAAALYNVLQAGGIDLLRELSFGRHLKLVQLDVFSIFTGVIASPSTYALINVSGMSQGNYTLNPDTYLFWDSLHPTTRGHNLLALAAAKLLAKK